MIHGFGTDPCDICCIICVSPWSWCWIICMFDSRVSILVFWTAMFSCTWAATPWCSSSSIHGGFSPGSDQLGRLPTSSWYTGFFPMALDDVVFRGDNGYWSSPWVSSRRSTYMSMNFRNGRCVCFWLSPYFLQNHWTYLGSFWTTSMNFWFNLASPKLILWLASWSYDIIWNSSVLLRVVTLWNLSARERCDMVWHRSFGVTRSRVWTGRWLGVMGNFTFGHLTWAILQNLCTNLGTFLTTYIQDSSCLLRLCGALASAHQFTEIQQIQLLFGQRQVHWDAKFGKCDSFFLCVNDCPKFPENIVRNQEGSLSLDNTNLH